VKDIHQSTEAYLSWLGREIPLLPEDLKLKDSQMRLSPFPFLRATYYRWAETFPEVCAGLMKVPEVLGVGDLHVENFGTWRDSEGRLVWGVNDFDEASMLPYTVDLVRLATSAYIALEEAHLQAEESIVAPAILKGYQTGLKAGGSPFVLAEQHAELHEMATTRLKDATKFWNKLNNLGEVTNKVPAVAQKALIKALPNKKMEIKIVHRQAGLGSLGRHRYTALAHWSGGEVAREVKQLVPSAWRFAGVGAAPRKVLYMEIVDNAIRCADPFLQFRDGWVVRRLAPDCSRVELISLPKNHDAEILLGAMGWEVANIHLGSQKAKALLGDLKKRKENWLERAAQDMAEQVRKDWKAFRN
jgi:uncharacterized protein (DUF2252 family)